MASPIRPPPGPAPSSPNKVKPAAPFLATEPATPEGPTRGSGKFLNLILLTTFLICALQVFSFESLGLSAGGSLGNVRRAALASTDSVSSSTSSSTGTATSATTAAATPTGTGIVVVDPITGTATTIDPKDAGLIGSGGTLINPTSGSTTAATGSTTTGTSTTSSTTSTATDGVIGGDDGIVLDPLTPAGTAVFVNPASYFNVQDMSVIPTGQPLNITWKWKNVVIYPTMLSLEISAPPATSGKLAGSTLKTPLNQWFPVCINFTASSSTASYLWQVNMTAAAGYTLRLYDSTVGPNYSVQPGRLAMSTSSKFNLYLPGTNNNLIVALSDGSPSWARIGTGQVFAVLFSVAVLGVLV